MTDIQHSHEASLETLSLEMNSLLQCKRNTRSRVCVTLAAEPIYTKPYRGPPDKSVMLLRSRRKMQSWRHWKRQLVNQSTNKKHTVCCSRKCTSNVRNTSCSCNGRAMSGIRVAVVNSIESLDHPEASKDLVAGHLTSICCCSF